MVNRKFLDWNRPGLESTVQYLLDRFHTGLGNVVIATPGSRAGRRLLELLVHEAEQQGSVLHPPEIVTTGRLPEMLYTAHKPFADDLTQQMAWVKALREEPLDTLVPAPPTEDDLTAWLTLASLLARLHRELAADALDFKAVADCGATLESFHEEKRWTTLAAVQKRYLAILHDLELWDLQTARLFAIEHGECATKKEIVLAGTADLNLALKKMLDPIADKVTSLVMAPEKVAQRFDGYGCLVPEAWSDVEIDLSREQIEVAGNPADQAAKTLEAMAALEGRHAAEEITIGIPDEEVVPYLQQYLGQCGIPSRYGVGIPVQQTAPYRLLKAVADYLDGRRYTAFAELIRHPLVQAPLDEVDEFYNEHLPYRLEGSWPGRDLVERLVADLDHKKKPLNQWSRSLSDLLVELFGHGLKDPSLESDRIVIAFCEKIHAVLQALQSMHKSLVPVLSGSEAIKLVLQQLGRQGIPPLPKRGAVELLGWLELMLDDAPALIVTGFNEGVVPSSLNADLFLPNRLRTRLGIEDNDRRYARDAYALTVLARSREDLMVIAGRRTRENDPLHPSRLLFACHEKEAAKRALIYFSDKPDRATRRPGIVVAGQQVSRIPIPEPAPLTEPVTSMRVTEFRDYLACPYRYYLRHRLHLSGLDDRAQELDAGAFGSLAHAVLSLFGQSRCALSEDAKKIRDWLFNCLDRLGSERFGTTALAAVRVQMEQLKRRFDSFAKWQAGWVCRGWRIEHVEVSRGTAQLVVDGEPMALRGRIDRIDVNEEDGKRIIFDYKTSDTARKPESVHQRKGEWVDLQLPLYRHLAGGLGIALPVQLGFIVLPKAEGKVKELVATWTETDLEGADRVAEEVIRKVREEAFSPPASDPPRYADEFSALCQDHHLRGGRDA